MRSEGPAIRVFLGSELHWPDFRKIPMRESPVTHLTRCGVKNSSGAPNQIPMADFLSWRGRIAPDCRPGP
jgi:hypothetical protein